MKTCRRCDVAKPLGEFYREAATPDGYGRWCRDCAKAVSSARYHANKAQAAETARAWRERNRDRHLENRRRWYRANRERERRTHRAWLRANPDQARDRNRRRKRALGGVHRATVRFAEIVRLDPCAYCGRRGGTVEHVEPISSGGPHHWSNLGGACASCNARKGATSLLAFLRRTVPA